MPAPSSALRPAVAAAALAACAALTARAGDLRPLARGLAAPFRALHREKPPTHIDCDVERLAARIDWLQHQLDADGSIVAKEPDVWGQSRLMRHRYEYEEQMRRQLGAFTERSSAAIRRSDQAFLGMALAVQSASGRRRGPNDVAVPDATGSASVVNSIQGLLPTTNEAVGRSDPVIIARTAPFAVPEAPPGFRFADQPLGLEPTVHLDHLSRYLHHLAELRRVNEGDDSADAPGYALNLVRIPVSVTPGGRTCTGHGAEITIRVEPVLGPDLLPATFRNLVINDLVDVIAPALTWCVNDPESAAWAETIATDGGAGAAEPARRQGVLAAMDGLAARLPVPTPAAAPAVKVRRARLPLPVTQLADVAGIGPIAILVRDTRAALANHPANRPCIDYLDVRGHLAEELEAAYDLLCQPEHRDVWAELAGWNLAALVRGRRLDEIAALRCRFLAGLGAVTAAVADSGELLLPGADVCCGPARPNPPLCRTTTAVLAWGILVESALLDDRLAEDIRETAAARGGVAVGRCTAPAFGPDPPPEAREAFAAYVRARWPVRVFALDPVREEQNVDDTYARRRELQIAMATAAATGRLNAQAMARFTRRLETDMAVVALNQTAVGFTHGSDTFGWRFYPRVQTPPTRGTLATMAETFCGPASECDLAARKLEPGPRECTALVVMPSFVPALTFDVRSTWFSLAHPGRTDQTMRHTMELSRAVQALRHDEAACARCAHRYRPGEVARLLAEVEKLDRRLPLQTLQARIPYENTAGGFELFSSGVTDLAPELVGWYGAPGIDPGGATTLFLVGKGFSVHDTSVVAGGLPCRFTLVSREVLRVEVPAGARTIAPPACDGVAAAPRRAGLVLAAATEPLPAPTPADDDDASPVAPPEAARGPAPLPAAPCGALDCNRREVVDVHLATPYGVSGHLLVPVVRSSPDAGGGPAFADACRIDLTFTVAKAAGTRAEAARIDEYFASSCDALAIAVPASFVPPAKVELRLLVRDAATGATAAGFSVADPPFDARASRYVIAGGDLRNFVGDTSRPATDKTLRGALKPYLDHLLAAGGLADDGESAAFTVTAALVAGQQVVPVGGAIDVRATRRGPTVVEPAPAAAP
ncbi:MAG: hypothetical protein ACKOSQ_05540 [Planctomycetaceae bacterium]